MASIFFDNGFTAFKYSLAPDNPKKTLVENVPYFGCGLEVLLNPETLHLSEQNSTVVFDKTGYNLQSATSVQQARKDKILNVTPKQVLHSLLNTSHFPKSPLRAAPIAQTSQEALYHAVSEALDIPQLDNTSKRVLEIHCMVEDSSRYEAYHKIIQQVFIVDKTIWLIKLCI